MKAVVYYQYGPPEVLKLASVTQPEPKDDELLIKVRAVEVTKSDCELRSFNFPVSWFWLPLRLAWGLFKPRKHILGGYFSGEVISSSSKSELKAGDAIFGCCGLNMGAYGTHLCISHKSTLVAKPTNMSFEEAAAVPLGGLNALHFLRKANIQPGERVLINGAGGSIGLFAVQIAKTMGAEVTAVDAAHKEAMLLSIGADHFINYQQQDFTKLETKYQVIFDMVATNSYSACLKSLEQNGRYLLGNPRLSDMLRAGFTSKFTDKEVFFAFAAERKEELMELKNLIEKGRVRAVVDQILPMQKAAMAHHLVQSEQRIGSVVMKIEEDS